MAILRTIDDGVTVTEAIRLALEHAVAELGGIGGMVHMGGPEGLRGLHLVASSGLPPAMTESWVRIPDDGGLPPVRAVREGARIWLPAVSHGEPSSGTTSAGAECGRGLATVPLPGPDGPPGALTVVTGTSYTPESGQWSFLESVAGWAALSCPRSRHRRSIRRARSCNRRWRPYASVPGSGSWRPTR
ncbi:hypothetical protein ACH4UV_05150 [Streptomyces sp. NPDC020802]|uniref:hypothetical protein n=1 Tax=Streptomyces sp. NPDC020802 TaxID=3365094 RepID=UPI00379A3B9A